jgi:Fe-S oxidoreductase
MNDLKERTRLCSVCYKMCRDFCSVAGATRHEADSPNHRAFFVEEIMHGKDTLRPEIVDYFYRCSMCKACREACESGLDTSEIMLSARSDLSGELHPQRLKILREKILTGTLYAQDSDMVRALMAPRLAKPRKGKLLYLSPRLRSGDGGMLKSTFSLLERLEVDYQVMKTEPSTGQLAYFLGFTKEARQMAQQFAQQIDAWQPTTLVVFSADDLRMIKKEYPTLGIGLNVGTLQSLPEFLLEVFLAKRPSLSQKVPGPVTYHDSCALGRELRVFEAPRELLRMVPGIELKEMAFNRDQAPCCGYGMGLEITHPEITLLMARRLAGMAEDTGAKALVLGCPTCALVLNEALSSQERSQQAGGGIELLDLPSFLERMMQ